MKKSAFSLALPVFFLLACSKGNNPVPVATEIEYRLASSTSAVATEITYTNESGGVTTLENTALPFAVKVKRDSKPGSVSLLIANINDAQGSQQSLTGSLLVNGHVVDSETGNGTNARVSLGYSHP